jgi:hypothetical protein
MAWTKLVTKCDCIRYLDIPEECYDWDVPLPDRRGASRKMDEDLSTFYPILKRRFRFTGAYESRGVRIFFEAD